MPPAARSGARASTLLLALSLLSAGCGSPSSSAERPPPTVASPADELASLCQLAAGDDASAADAAIAALRARGPEGLEAVLATLASPGLTEPRAARLRSAAARVARQRDAHVAGLFWYTDLDSARAAAARTHRPILALRLLGDLGDELSCANSRFFRAALYANRELSAALREGFVLVWTSERKAPRIDIDYGDGRRLTRTITGNSIHYILDEQGRLVDALPGLYGPQAFRKALEAAAEQARSVAALEGEARQASLGRYHQERLEALRTGWRGELAADGAPADQVLLASLPSPLRPPSAAPAADVAGRIGIGKGRVEMPALGVLLKPAAPAVPAPVIDEPRWARIARRHADDARLDPSSRALVAEQAPLDWSSPSPRPLGAPGLEALVASFEQVMALDTVRNEYTLHASIHAWLAAPSTPAAALNWVSLNERVYRELFLTPSTDPWLGLASPGAYTGLALDGLSVQGG